MTEVPDPYSIDQPLIMLCEGQGDNEVFRRLVEAKNLPEFSFPFPPKTKQEGDDEKPLHGKDGFVNMLSRLNSYYDLFPDRSQKLKGILICVDSRDKPPSTFRHVCKQIEEAG